MTVGEVMCLVGVVMCLVCLQPLAFVKKSQGVSDLQCDRSLSVLIPSLKKAVAGKRYVVVQIQAQCSFSAEEPAGHI